MFIKLLIFVQQLFSSFAPSNVRKRRSGRAVSGHSADFLAFFNPLFPAKKLIDSVLRAICRLLASGHEADKHLVLIDHFLLFCCQPATKWTLCCFLLLVNMGHLEHSQLRARSLRRFHALAQEEVFKVLLVLPLLLHRFEWTLGKSMVDVVVSCMHFAILKFIECAEYYDQK